MQQDNILIKISHNLLASSWFFIDVWRLAPFKVYEAFAGNNNKNFLAIFRKF